MKLDEAKQILNRNGYHLVEGTMSLEDKINKAYNFNIENLFKGVEKELIKTYKKVTMDASDYDDDNNSQLVRYYFKFNKNSYMLEVLYYDEDGIIELQLIDEDAIGADADDFSVSTIDKAIEQIIDFVDYKLNN